MDLPSMSDAAIHECLADLRAACHRPINQAGLDTLTGWLRPQFDRILNHPEGHARWADHDQIMRDNARHIGALADFFAHQADIAIVGINELTQAFEMVRAACNVRVTRWEAASSDAAADPQEPSTASRHQKRAP